VTWVDVERGNGAIDFGDHWGVVVRARGIPRWFHLEGTGTGGRWTDEDIRLGALARNSLIRRPLSGGMVPETLLRRLRSQRLDPLAGAFKASVDGLPPVHKIIVLPSDLMMGVPIEALASPEDGWIISYAPSATIFAQLTRLPKAEAPGGLLALGNPRFEPPIVSSNHAPLPDHGLLAATVVPGGNAARHGLKARDVVTAYNDTFLHGYDDLKIATTGDKAIPIKVWRDGEISERGVDPGELGVVFDPRPASVAVLDTRRLDAVLLAASTRSERLEGLPGTRYEIEALGRTFAAARRPFRILSDDNASEQNIDQIAASSDLSRFAFIHLATHALIDEINPDRSAVILAQTGLPDPLVQVLNKKTVYDGKLTTREIEHDWNLKAELVTLSACETANGKFVSGEGFVGFTQSLLISGARSVCLSLWKVDDAATALLMERFYANLLAARPGLSMPLPKAEALAEAKSWLRALHRDEIAELAANLSGGDARSKDAPRRKPAPPANSAPPGLDENHPYAHPYYWSAFVLVGNPD
jgi:CHAT domain